MSNYPDILTELYQANLSALQAQGLSLEHAKLVAINVIENIQKNLQGAMFYVPKKHAQLIIIRNQKIAAEFNGYNHFELAQKYDLSLKCVYEILKKYYQSAQSSLL